MKKRASAGYTLPPYNAQDRLLAYGGKPDPVPMEGVKSDWVGLSKDDLLKLPDWMPKDMRLHPRSYLSPPAAKATKATKTDSWVANRDRGLKRDADEANASASAPPGSFLQPPPPASIGLHPSLGSRPSLGPSSHLQSLFLRPPPRLPADPVEGQHMHTSFDHTLGKWMYVFESGKKIAADASSDSASAMPTFGNSASSVEQTRAPKRARTAGTAQTPSGSARRVAQRPLNDANVSRHASMAPRAPPAATVSYDAVSAQAVSVAGAQTPSEDSMDVEVSASTSTTTNPAGYQQLKAGGKSKAFLRNRKNSSDEEDEDSE